MGTALDELEDDFPDEMDAAADFLSHYGVRGMKWGRRKSGVVKEAPSEDAARVGGLHGRVKSQKSTHMLTNKELEDAIKRMNLEQQYSRMSNGLDKTRRQKLSAFVRELVAGVAKETITNVAKDQVKLVVEKKTQTGRHDPLTVANREAQLKKLRTPQNGG